MNIAKDLAQQLPILSSKEKYHSDIDLFIDIANHLGDGQIFDVCIAGSHLEFNYCELPVAIFNIASLHAPYFIDNLNMTAQGIADMKFQEIDNWKQSHKCFILISFEIGNAMDVNKDSNSFSRTAHENNDYRYSILCDDILERKANADTDKDRQ